MTSSIYPIAVTPNATPIASGDILSSPIVITNDQVKPGGGGILRLYFSFEYAATPAIVSVLENGVLKGNLNADNAAQTITDGLYRFDIDVEAGDSLNLQADSQIDTVNYVRAHLVQFGA